MGDRHRLIGGATNPECNLYFYQIMYYLTLIILSVIGFIGMPVRQLMAQPVIPNSSCNPAPADYVEPATLISMAYSGAFTQQGIPRAEILLDEYEAGNITPVKIVEAAIRACVVSNTQNLTASPTYLNQLNSQLQSLSTQSH
uniref:Uncharacterized protein n=1 Tax=Cyanothece sp. (strain PCC 7425 / ATCC 29141) TaxID=395961 RepID=B8HY32_CYAP4